MRKLILTSLAALFAVGAANAALLPEPGVVSTTTYNAKVGDSADLGDLGDGVVIPAIMEIKDAISDESGDIINLGDEITIITNALGNKQDKLTAGAARNTAAGKVAIWGGTLGGTDGTGQTEGAVEMITDYSGIVENATGLTTGHAVYGYGENLINEVVPGIVEEIVEEIVGELTDGKQDKLTGSAATAAKGKVAVWDSGTGEQTSGAVEMLTMGNDNGGNTNQITAGATGLTTGKAVYEYVAEAIDVASGGTTTKSGIAIDVNTTSREANLQYRTDHLNVDTAPGTGDNKLTVKVDGAVASGNTGIVTGGTVYTALDGKEDVSNKLKSETGGGAGITSAATDTQYASGLAVYEYGQEIESNVITELTENFDEHFGDNINNYDLTLNPVVGNKQDKLVGSSARNTAAGKVAIWGGTLGGTDGTGQTEGAVEMITDYSGIVENATGLTTGHAVYGYGENLINEVVPGIVEEIVEEIVGELTDGKQDKLTGSAATAAKGKVAIWDSTDGKQTSEAKEMIDAGGGIGAGASGATGLTTGKAVHEYVQAQIGSFPTLDPTCMDAGINKCILSQDMNGPGGTLQWVWLKMY